METDMEKCIMVIKNVPKHKAFVNDIKESKLVKSIIDAKSIIYYSFNAPWPFADYDCVTQMTFTEDKSKNIAVFSLVAAPLLYPKTKLDRLTEYEISYSFKDLKNGKVEITITGKTSPHIKIPLWMLKRTMPDRPAGVIRKIVKLANDIK
jgi:hypothetical protein